MIGSISFSGHPSHASAVPIEGPELRPRVLLVHGGGQTMWTSIRVATMREANSLRILPRGQAAYCRNEHRRCDAYSCQRPEWCL